MLRVVIILCCLAAWGGLVPVQAQAGLADLGRSLRERFDPGVSYGLYVKVLQAVEPWDAIAGRIETNIAQSDWELVASWDLDTPDACVTRARVYVVRNEDYDRAVLAKGVRRAAFLPLRIGLYQRGPEVVVIFTNPEALSKVFFADLPFVEQDEMMALAREAKKDLVTLCVKGMQGTILTQQLAPVRNDRDIRFFWSRAPEQVDVVRRFPVRDDPARALEEACRRIVRSLADPDTGWRLVFRARIGPEVCILGVTNPHVEDQALNFSGLTWPSILDRDPCSGLYHLTQFPLEILVFVEQGQVKAALLDQFWRMRFYLWDDPYRTGTIFMARDPNFSARIYDSLVRLIRRH